MEQPDVFPVDSTTFKSILEVYGRTEESFEEDVAALKKWMKGQPHFPEIMSDKYLQNFLIMNKCSVERAKPRIDTYYTVRNRIPEFCGPNEPDLANLKRVMDIIYFFPLPKLTKQNHRLYFFKVRRPDLIHQLDPYDMALYAMNMQEIRLIEDVMYGDMVIFDWSGGAFECFKKMTPPYLAKAFSCFEKIWSMPMKGVYAINSHPFVATILAMIKVLVKPKIFDRFQTCQDTSLLYEKFPKEILPKDYGGKEKSLEELQEQIKKKLFQHQERLYQLHALKVDENLRPEKLENDEHLGFYGNFKKLSVD